MDFVTVAGILIGVIAIIGGQAIEGGSILSLLQGPAAVIVFGGTLGATAASYSLKDLMRAAKALIMLVKPPAMDLDATVESIVGMVNAARKEGILALEKKVAEVDHPFMKKYLQNVVDGVDAEMLMEHMETEIDVIEEEMAVSPKVFETAGGYAPTIGIIGAVLGLIQTMQNLNDPSKLGTGIAVAFVATVYGVGSANLIFLPIASKLKRCIEGEILSYTLIKEGLLSLQAGHNPKMVSEKLHIFLSEKRNEAA